MAKTARKAVGKAVDPKAPKPAARPRRVAKPSAPATSVAARRRTTPSKKIARPVAPGSLEPTHDEIAVRAYFIAQRRHGQPGNPDRDWLQAIDELRAERN